MKDRIIPTDPEGEHAKGRTALWLDTADLEWLAQHCGCTSETTLDEKDRCARVRFRAHAALHKTGLKSSASE